MKPETTQTQTADGRTVITNHQAQTEPEQYKTYEYDSFNETRKVVVEQYDNGNREVHIQRNFYDAENLRYGMEEDGEQTYFVGAYSQNWMRSGNQPRD